MSVSLALFLMFCKICVTCFGGGYGMMSMILDEGSRMVGLTPKEFADLTVVDLICPGSLSMNAATFIGYIKGKVPGAVTATLGMIIPSLIIALFVLVFLNKFRENRIVRAIFRGAMPACGGLLLYAAVTLFLSIFFGSDSVYEMQFVISPNLLACLILLAITLVMEFKFKVDPIWLTVVGATFGLLFIR